MQDIFQSHQLLFFAQNIYSKNIIKNIPNF